MLRVTARFINLIYEIPDSQEKEQEICFKKKKETFKKGKRKSALKVKEDTFRKRDSKSALKEKEKLRGQRQKICFLKILSGHQDPHD